MGSEYFMDTGSPLGVMMMLWNYTEKVVIY